MPLFPKLVGLEGLIPRIAVLRIVTIFYLSTISLCHVRLRELKVLVNGVGTTWIFAFHWVVFGEILELSVF